MLNQRLRELRKMLGLTQGEFAFHVGTSPGYVSEAEQGKKVPGGEILRRICEKLNANINWLLTGSGDMFLEGHAGSLPSGSAPVRTTEYDFVSVTPYRAWESQSHGACVWQMDAHSILWLYRPWIECHLRISKEVVWSLCMQGDNMDPTLRAGDILLVDGSCKEVAIEGIYLICCDGMHAVRRVQRMGSTLTLSNDNSAYRDTDLDVSRKGLEIIGRVVARLAAL